MSYSANTGINIAVIGATGMVGMTALKILYERKFPVNNIYAVASNNSSGIKVSFGNNKITVVDLESFDFSKVDIALFCVRAEIAKIFVPKAVEKSCIVVDNSSYFRMDNDVPLVVPEVNLHDIKNVKKNIIANPNCIAIPLAVTLAPLHEMFKIKRVVVATYQSISGAGKIAADELLNQTKDIIKQKDLINRKFSKQIAFNLIPHIDVLEENGFTKEENKIRNEIKKIIDSNIEVVATCVRVPVFFSHSMAVNIEFENSVTIREAISILQDAPGIFVSCGIHSDGYISPVDTTEKDLVYVSRIREDTSTQNTLCAWIVADNIRKGAALNAVQIAECLFSISQKSQHKEEQVNKVHI